MVCAIRLAALSLRCSTPGCIVLLDPDPAACRSTALALSWARSRLAPASWCKVHASVSTLALDLEAEARTRH